MDQPQTPSEAPPPPPQATPRNIRKAHESLHAEFIALRDHVQHALEDKLAAVTANTSGQEPTHTQDVLTEHERDVLQFCRLSDRMLASEAIFNQFKGRRVTKKTKLSTETLDLWQKVIFDRPELVSGGAGGDDETGGQELDHEEYRKPNRDPSLVRDHS
jgi:hypothetical protein